MALKLAGETKKPSPPCLPDFFPDLTTGLPGCAVSHVYGAICPVPWFCKIGDSYVRISHVFPFHVSVIPHSFLFDVCIIRAAPGKISRRSEFAKSVAHTSWEVIGGVYPIECSKFDRRDHALVLVGFDALGSPHFHEVL